MSPACLKVSRGVTSGFEHFCFPAPHSASLLPVAHSVRVALSLWDPGTRVPFLHSLRHRARGGPWSAPAAPPPKPSSACSDLSAWATGTRRLPGPHGTQDAGPTGASGGSPPSSPGPPFPCLLHRRRVGRGGGGRPGQQLPLHLRGRGPLLWSPRRPPPPHALAPPPPWRGHRHPARVTCRPGVWVG